MPSNPSVVCVVQWAPVGGGAPVWTLHGIYVSEGAARAAVDLWAAEPRDERRRMGLSIGMPWLYAGGLTWAISPVTPHYGARVWLLTAYAVQGDGPDSPDAAMAISPDGEPSCCGHCVLWESVCADCPDDGHQALRHVYPTTRRGEGIE